MAVRSMIAILFAIASPLVLAQENGKHSLIDPAVLSAGFLESHPDLDWRLKGLRAYRKQEFKTALRYFLRAARYADKPSQGMVADMYWAGLGTPVDRSLGYAWMDLAAERSYPQFAIFRERYWDALNAAERADALERGKAVYAEYRDSVAKPRLEKELRRGRARSTGSRTGSTGTGIWIGIQNGPAAGNVVRGDEFYAKKYWVPEKYWQLQDKIWKAPKRGQVHVGELEQAESEVE